MSEDREVWKRICDGDAIAFNELYRELGPRLYAFASRMTQSTTAAEDILQETFLEFWRRPHKYDPAVGGLRAWLFGVARRRVAAYWRKFDGAATDAVEGVAAEDLEASRLLQDAIDRLPGQQRLLLWLREVEGQSYEELARILEIPVGTVRSRLFTAREALRRIWRGESRRKEMHDEVR